MIPGHPVVDDGPDPDSREPLARRVLRGMTEGVLVEISVADGGAMHREATPAALRLALSHDTAAMSIRQALDAVPEGGDPFVQVGRGVSVSEWDKIHPRGQYVVKEIRADDRLSSITFADDSRLSWILGSESIPIGRREGPSMMVRR